jgi:hypothetical protein
MSAHTPRLVRIAVEHEDGMASELQPLPLDDWLKLSDAELAERRRSLEQESDPEPVAAVESQIAVQVAPHVPEVSAVPYEAQRTPTVDEVHRLARSLTHLNRLKLAARLWSSLPPTYRSALLQLQLEDFQNPEATVPAGPSSETSGPNLRRFLFDRTNTSELYSAPRRFDLATIFVVTAAYSLLLGGLSALDFGPEVKFVAVGLLTVVAAGQALFHDQANPRGVSVMIGASAYALFTLAMWSMYPRAFPRSFFFVVVINGLLFGSLLGYISGVLVGGMFLVAERLREKLSPQETQPEASCDATDLEDSRAADSVAGSESSPFVQLDTRRSASGEEPEVNGGRITSTDDR